MKYAMNHSWKFRKWFTAWAIGFAQFSIMIIVEIVCIATLITNATIMDIIMNFLALVVVSEFDDMLF